MPPWNAVTFDSNGLIKDARTNPRNIRGQLTFDDGVIRANGYQEDGIYTDGFFIQTLVPDGAARTITNITNSSTPKATYTGTLLVEGEGLSLPVISSGMTEISERLIRVRNPTASDFDVYQDGDDNGYNPTQTIEGNTQTDTSGYGTWSGTAAAQAYTNLNTGSGNPTLPTDADVRVVSAGFVPPTNVNGAANAVPALNGGKILSTTTYYYKPNEVITGNTFNSPRFSARLSAGQDFAYNEEEWICWPYFLPSNFDHETTHDGDLSKNALFRVVDSSSVNDNPYTIFLGGWASGSYDHWMMDYAPGVSDNDVQDVDLGSVEDDIDLWGWLIIRLLNHTSNGALEIWKTTGGDQGGGTRAMTKVFSETGTGIGFVPSGNFEHAFRQYKFGWHTSNNTIDSLLYNICLAKARYGGVNESTGFSDVHPFGAGEP